MNRDELKVALDSHSAALESHGLEVCPAIVEGPAAAAELDEVESRLGFELPPSFRGALETLSGEVHWSWRDRREDAEFPEPFSQIFSGELDWSVATIVERHKYYQGWVDECFSNPDDPYDAEWHGKLGFFYDSGDVVAVDLAPDRLGEIVYLSHDDGEGHGYVMARSLADLVNRWVPLACPGAGDWQWLPFVSYDLGPIDPCCPNAGRWRSLLGLNAAAAITEPSIPDDALFDSLLESYRRDPGALMAGKQLRRALRVCTTARLDQILELLEARDDAARPPAAVAEAAARLLGEWDLEAAVPTLARAAVTGSQNARIAALVALRGMSGPDAAAARETLRAELDPNWTHLLRRP
jgi:cell wall assembly regulator SMI1